MRVVCHTVEEFLANLAHDANNVFRKIVYLSRSEHPIAPENVAPSDIVKFEIIVQASCVVDLCDGGQYILDAGIDCGLDYRDASNEEIGSEQARKVIGLIESFCSEFGLSIRPGVVDL